MSDEEKDDLIEDLYAELHSLEEEIAEAKGILDPENRFSSLFDACEARMRQIVELEALR